jgi:hypothetical protein
MREAPELYPANGVSASRRRVRGVNLGAFGAVKNRCRYRGAETVKSWWLFDGEIPSHPNEFQGTLRR